VTGLGVEELHPGVEMTHVRVSEVDERLDLSIDRPDDVTGKEIADDDSPILQERADHLLGPCISFEPLEQSAMTWRHVRPL
jgi:hypothetical protein